MVSSKDAFEEKTYGQPSGFSSSDYVPGRIHFLNWRHGPASRICRGNEAEVAAGFADAIVRGLVIFSSISG
jgi:hypothetical protein